MVFPSGDFPHTSSLCSSSFPLVMVQLRLKDSANTNVVYSTTLSCHQVNLMAIPFMGAGLGCSDFYCTHLQIHQLIISSKLYVNTTFTVCISLTQTDTRITYTLFVSLRSCIHTVVTIHTSRRGSRSITGICVQYDILHTSKISDMTVMHAHVNVHACTVHMYV